MTEDEFDERLRALSHTERRRLYRACRGRWQAAGSLAEGTSLALPTVSEHLKVLRKAGLVELHREGRFWQYRALTESLDAVVAALAHLQED